MKVTQFGPGSLPLALAGWSTGVVSVNSNFHTEDGGFSATNFVQGITAEGSNMLLRPIANFAAGSNIILTLDAGPGNSIPSNTIRIHGQAGGGASVSYGSNSSTVAEISSAGASTSVARFDHYHDGIGTITASSSNTLQRGTFNLRPGSGIAIGLTDTDGDGEFDTATISTTAGGGGGGSSYAGVGSTEHILTDPTGLSWSWVNQGSATITSYGASLVLHDPANATESMRMRVKSVPSKPYSVIVHLKAAQMPVGFSEIIVGWLQTSDNHFAGIAQYFNPSGHWFLSSDKSGTNFSITAVYKEVGDNIDLWQWIKLTDDSSNRKIYVSRDGNDWLEFHSVATNDFITPDRLMFGVASRNSSSYDANIIIDSWLEA